jgi:adenine-specific DNA-methyltransferase
MLYPKRHLRKIVEKNPVVLRAIWQALNDISLTTLISEGRTYGGGLCKIEPRELGNTPADGVAAVLPSFSKANRNTSQK